MPILAPIAEDVDRLSEQERQRLFSLATVRGYRIQTNNRTGTHTIVRLGHQTATFRTPPTRASQPYASKKLARRALLRLMLDQTGRTAA